MDITFTAYQEINDSVCKVLDRGWNFSILQTQWGLVFELQVIEIFFFDARCSTSVAIYLPLN